MSKIQALTEDYISLDRRIRRLCADILQGRMSPLLASADLELTGRSLSDTAWALHKAGVDVRALTALAAKE